MYPYNVAAGARKMGCAVTCAPVTNLWNKRFCPARHHAMIWCSQYVWICVICIHMWPRGNVHSLPPKRAAQLTYWPYWPHWPYWPPCPAELPHPPASRLHTSPNPPTERSSSTEAHTRHTALHTAPVHLNAKATFPRPHYYQHPLRYLNATLSCAPLIRPLSFISTHHPPHPT